MVTKIFKTTGIIFLLLTLWACPFRHECSREAMDLPKYNLISVIPIDTVYHVGDQLVYTAIIPSRIDSLDEDIYENFESLDVDIYEDTGITSTRLINSEINKFDGNAIEVLKGFTQRSEYDNSLQAYVIYNPTNKVYEFQARITFTRPGIYRIISGMNILFHYKNSKCVAYELKTNIEGLEIGSMWEFRVVP